MENLFDNTVLVFSLTFIVLCMLLLCFSLYRFWTDLSSRMTRVELKLFDKSKLKYTDGDNT